MNKITIFLIVAIALIPLLGLEAFAANPNLFVSAENSAFENMFTGSQVVEVVIIDPNLRDTDSGKGEPDVTINGKKLRMVQDNGMLILQMLIKQKMLTKLFWMQE